MNDIISTNILLSNVPATLEMSGYVTNTQRRRIDMNIVSEKYCSRCGETKTALAFSKHSKSKDKLAVWCKDCTKQYLAVYRAEHPADPEYQKTYYKNNKERLNKMSKDYAESHKDETRAYKSLWYEQNKEITKERSKKRGLLHPKTTVEGRRARLRRYGITQQDYERMYMDQGGCCSICGDFYDKLHVDHNHTTGKVRELLCANCNRALGMVKEKESVLEKAIAYLKKHMDV